MRNFAPEIKAAIGDSKLGRVNTSPRKELPADVARDVKAGIKEGSAQDQRLDAMPQNMQRPARPQALNTVQNSTLPDAAHIAAATSIAHAILNKRNGVV